MCGRFNITESPALRALLTELSIDLDPLPVRFNIAPTESVLTIYQSQGINHIADMRWWLTPSWSDGPSQKFAMFNARSETITTSRAYRAPFQRQRAIIPASAFIEWQRNTSGKQAYEISSTNNALVFAGIWDHWEGKNPKTGEQAIIDSCAIVTCQATPEFAVIHSRQPVLLNSNEIPRWLDNETDSETLKQLMTPKLPTSLHAKPIDKSVGNARNKAATQVVTDAPEISIKPKHVRQ